jgi:hypothetical protein
MALHPPWLFLKSKVMSEFESLGLDDVVLCDSAPLVKQSPFLGRQFTAKLQDLFTSQNVSGAICTDGIACRLLKPGENWQKGKLRIRVEFCPDDSQLTPPSRNSLDEFRQ